MVVTPHRLRRTALLAPLIALTLAGTLVDGASAAHPLVDAASAPVPADRATAPSGHVLAISVDGFNPRSLRKLGRKRTPNFHWLIRHGAATLNARTARERTETLPNHTGMVTGRRINAAHGGHGVTFNYERPTMTVQLAAGHAVSSVFEVVHDGGGTTSVYAGKDKFRLFQRSWPDSIAKTVIRGNASTLVDKAAKRLGNRPDTFTFVHLTLPDRAGHAHGFMGRAYLAAVRRTDRLLGRLLSTVRTGTALKGSTWVVLTADHGGGHRDRHHSRRKVEVNYRIPFMVWGPGIPTTNLYRISPGYAAPGHTRPSYKGPQPVRNGDVANLSTRLLGLSAVPDSEFGTDQLLATGSTR